MIEDIIEKAKAVYGVDPYNKSRKKEYVWARQAVFNKLYRAGWSNRRLQEEFGKNHATIIHSRKTHSNLLEVDKEYQRLFNLFSPQKTIFTFSNKEKLLEWGYNPVMAVTKPKDNIRRLLDCKYIFVTEETEQIYVDVALATGIKIIRG